MIVFIHQNGRKQIKERKKIQ